MGNKEIKRCEWAKDPYDINYHDSEWGVPCHDDRELFELLVLEGMQAGLTWNLILKRREHMREAFDNFDFNIIAGYDADKIALLLENPKIIRNRAKVNSLVSNAKAFIKVREEFGSFDAFLWSFTNGKTITGGWSSLAETPVSSELSDKLSSELKKRGFKFVGTVICYSFLQATGLLNDHVPSCDFYEKCKQHSEQ